MWSSLVSFFTPGYTEAAAAPAAADTPVVLTLPPRENTVAEKLLVPSLARVEASLARFPVIDIGSRAGETNYIDFIRVGELRDNAVVRGVDAWRRPFFVARGCARCENDDTVVPWMQTFFQRYTDRKSLWVGCGHGFDRHLLRTEGGIREVQADLLANLLTEGRVKVDNDTEARCSPFKEIWLSNWVTSPRRNFLEPASLH